ncbi:MAG: hypothetical protein LUP95_01310, partial [Euryarchaeota archaeon]|nr:hypothetical protein [Euryarchaeota archaeon]
LPYPNDSTFFYGGNKEGNAFTCRMAFRDPKRTHEYCLDFYLEGLGFFGIKDDPGPDGEGFEMGNLKWEPLEIGKQWRITYEGPVKNAEGEIHQNKVDLIFTGEHPIINLTDYSDRKQLAKAIACEKWTKDFFLKLKELSQTHIEQAGNIKGTIILDGKRFDLTLRAMRDHTFGSRSWLTWDRHYLMSGSADNGYQWTVSVIRFDFLGQLNAGCVIDKDGEVDAIVDCTNLEEVSAKQLLPDDGMITLKTRSGTTHTLEFLRHGHFPYLMDESYWLYEGIGSCKFNDSEGPGLVEFGFKKARYQI